MHEGLLTPRELRAWVQNRYYYQTRIPIKDALILSKSEDRSFRRAWIRRIHDHDGLDRAEGGLELWQRLAHAMGIPQADLVSFAGVLPGVRFACDSYVSFVRDATLTEAVASSLTELFAPDLMSERIHAFERHYDFVEPSALQYFRGRVHKARRDSEEALEYVIKHVRTYPEQERCVHAVVRKTEILWQLLDCVEQVEADGRAHDRSSI